MKDLIKYEWMKALVLSFAFCFQAGKLAAVCNEAWFGGQDGFVGIIDTTTQMEINSFQPVMEQVIRIAFTPDGSQAYLAAGGGFGLSAVNTSTLADTIIDSSSDYFDVVTSPDGKFAYGIAANGYIIKVDTSTNTFSVLYGISNLFAPVAAALSPDGTILYVAGILEMPIPLPEVLLLNTSDGSLINSTVVPGVDNLAAPSQMAITPNGQFLYLTDAIDHSVYQINTSTLIVNPVSTGAFPPFGHPQGVTIDLTGTLAYVADSSGLNLVDIIQISSNTVINQLSSPFINAPIGVAITPDGAFVYVGNNGSDNGAVINTANLSVTSIPLTAEMGLGVSLPAVAMAPLCSGSLKGRIGANRDLWQTELFSQLCWTFSSAATPSNFLVFRNGKQIATLSGSQTSFEDHNLKPDKTYVYSVYASTSGTQFLVGTVTLKTN